MPPVAIVDSDVERLEPTTYWALETTGLWKATSVGNGNAVWSQVLDTLTYVSDLADIKLNRVRCAPGGLVYVVAYGTDAEAQQNAYIFKSTNYGASWFHYLAQENVEYGSDLPFTLSIRTPFYSESPGISAMGSVSGNGGIVGLSGIFYNRTDAWPGITLGTVEVTPDTPMSSMKIRLGGVRLNWDWPNPTDTNDSRPLPSNDQFESYIVGVENPANIITYTPPFGLGEPVLRAISFNRGHRGNQADPLPRIQNYLYSWEIIEFNGIPIGGAPLAFDYAPTNTSWLYLGLTDKIIASEDGGVTWFDFYTDAGANDLIVDPQLAGAIYCWDTNGNLDLIMKSGNGQLGTLNRVLDTESPLAKPLRLSRSPNSGHLWAIKSGTTLRQWNSGVWSDQRSGLSFGTGLHSYVGGKLIFAAGDKIYVSEDYGTTTTEKTGDWATLSGAVNAHRVL